MELPLVLHVLLWTLALLLISVLAFAVLGMFDELVGGRLKHAIIRWLDRHGGDDAR